MQCILKWVSVYTLAEMLSKEEIGDIIYDHRLKICNLVPTSLSVYIFCNHCSYDWRICTHKCWLKVKSYTFESETFFAIFLSIFTKRSYRITKRCLLSICFAIYVANGEWKKSSWKYAYSFCSVSKKTIAYALKPYFQEMCWVTYCTPGVIYPLF